MTDFETHPAGTAARIEQLEDRANAATAAAYEVAAWVVEREGHSLGDEIRALATPDQTAALDKLIEEAEARVWEKVNTTLGKTYDDGLVSWPQYQRMKNALLAASKKGGV